MASIFQCIKYRWNQKTSVAASSIYDERISCLKKLADLQQKLKDADAHYLDVSTIEGVPHENALNRMEVHTREYKKEYELCEKILKY